MNDILLGALIVMAGIVPPVVTAIFTWKMAERSLKQTVAYGEGLRADFQNASQTLYEDMKGYLIADFKGTLMESIKDSINGTIGNKVRSLKGDLNNQANLEGLPQPVKSVIGKAVGGFLSDYGLPKKGVENAINSLLNKPSKEQVDRDRALVMQYARDAGMNPVQVPNAPIITE
jgi:hypothetical protein